MPTAADRPAATHLLQGHRALPLAAAGQTLGQGWSLHPTPAGWLLRGAGAGVRVNGATRDPDTLLGGGDTLRIGDGPELLLIEVTP